MAGPASVTVAVPGSTATMTTTNCAIPAHDTDEISTTEFNPLYHYINSFAPSSYFICKPLLVLLYDSLDKVSCTNDTASMI